MSETWVEPIFYHDGVTGWHHHHTEAGAIVHQTEAKGFGTELDWSDIILSAHMSDHDSVPNVDEVCGDVDCQFAEMPERETK